MCLSDSSLRTVGLVVHVPRSGAGGQRAPGTNVCVSADRLAAETTSRESLPPSPDPGFRGQGLGLRTLNSAIGLVAEYLEEARVASERMHKQGWEMLARQVTNCPQSEIVHCLEGNLIDVSR